MTRIFPLVAIFLWGFSPLAQAGTDVEAAIKSGSAFLIKSVLNDTYSLGCQSSDNNPCPFNNTGEILTAFFISKTLVADKSMPDEVRQKIIAMLEKNKQPSNSGGFNYGYHTGVNVDSDDTSFGLQTYLLLGKNVNIDGLNYFFIPNQNAYATFFDNQQVKPTTQPSAKNAFAIHPESNANVYSLFQALNLDSKINYPLVKNFQNPEGYWNYYFYPGKYYSTYKNMHVLCGSKKNFSLEINKGLKFIYSAQNPNGSWGNPDNSLDTALALNTLFACHVSSNAATQKGVKFLLESQTSKGYWKTDQIIWQAIWNAKHPDVIWYGYDIHHVLTTALAVQALINARNAMQTSQAHNP